MSTGLKVSSLSPKYVFYRPEHNAQEGYHGIGILKVFKCINIPTERAQNVDQKNGVSCLVIIFSLLPKLWSLNVKNDIFFVFSFDGSRESVTVWAKYFCVPGKFYLALENTMNYWFLSYHQHDINPWKYSILEDFADSAFNIFTVNISRMVTPNLINHTIFGKKSIRPFRCTIMNALKYFARL